MTSGRSPRADGRGGVFSVATGDNLTFVRGDGEMAALIRAFDWGSTSLGPLEAWPQSLKTTVALLLASPVAMVLIAGPHGVLIYNEGYARIADRRHPQILGMPVREAWPEAWDYNRGVLEKVMGGQTVSLRDQMLVLQRSGAPEPMYFDADYSPVPDESGQPMGALAILTETTERRAERLKMADQRARLEAMFEAAPSFMALLEGPDHVFTLANRAYLKLVGGRELIGKPVVEALPEVVDQGFTALLDQVLMTGQAIIMSAAPVQLNTAPGGTPETHYLDFVYQPLRDSGGRITGVFVEGYDVTGLYAAAETLKVSEARASVLLELNTRIAALNDPEEISFTAAEILAKAMQVDRAGYGLIDPRDETITIARDWNAPGVESLAGVLHFRDYGSYIEDLKRGDTAVVADAREDPRTRDTAAALEAINARSFVNMPVTEEGAFVALLYLNHSEPRFWTDEELGLIREVAAVTRSAVERRRAEDALRESEVRYRTLFDSMDEGFCVIEFLDGPHGPLSDYIHIEANPAYLTHTGIPNVVGQKVREMVPNEAGGWVDLYRQVLLSGDPMRFSKPLEINNRRLDVFTFRVEPPEKRQVAVLFRDVTEQYAAEVALHEEKRALEILNEAGAVVAADTNLETLVQRVVDAGVALTGAQFGAFFYNVVVENDEAYMLYALSGAPAEAFSSFPMPRITEIFAPTFNGDGILRSDDIIADPRYGQNPPFAGMPEGHLPVRSYLAVPVKSRDGSVLGGLLFGHGEVGRFGEEAERGLAGLAGQAATAIDNARLFQAAQTEIARRSAAEDDLQALNANLEARVASALAERRVLADVVDGTDAFVMVVDLNYRLMAINQACAREFDRVYGVRPRVGDNLLKLLAHMPEHQAAVSEVWARALGGDGFAVTEAFGDPARERRWYESRFSPLLDETGRRIGAFCFSFDISERLRDQARLREAEQALHQSQKMETVGQLTGGVAHDFNNLLTPIVGALDFLRRRAEDERTLRLTEGGLQAAERARVLVQRLLAFSRRQHLEPRPVDVSGLIEGMADLIQRSLGPQIELDVQAAADLPAAMVDPNQLELAVLNLAVNARDAMPDGGSLIVSVMEDAAPNESLPGRYVQIRVSDTGHGMDAETLARAVEPFFTTKGVGRGTGLGLSSVHGLAVQSGGAFVLESEPGKGVTARLWLPTTDELPDSAGITSRTVKAARSGGVVLLVDDEELVRQGAAEMLREAGFTVHLASGPEAALDMVTTGLSFDVMVTDYAMPGMNGADLAAAVRGQRPGAAILLITGFASLSDGKARNLPRLAKPFRQEDLAEAVNRLILA